MTPLGCCDESVVAQGVKKVGYGEGGIIRKFKLALKEGNALHYKFGSGVVSRASQDAQLLSSALNSTSWGRLCLLGANGRIGTTKKQESLFDVVPLTTLGCAQVLKWRCLVHDTPRTISVARASSPRGSSNWLSLGVSWNAQKHAQFEFSDKFHVSEARRSGSGRGNASTTETSARLSVRPTQGGAEGRQSTSRCTIH